MDTHAEEISAVRLTVPNFMETAVDAWFTILEAQLKLARISSEETQFYHALAYIPPTTVARLSKADLSSRNYQTLKDAVLKFYELSKNELFDSLVSSTMVGKPSIYLREMLNTAEKLNIGPELGPDALSKSPPTSPCSSPHRSARSSSRTTWIAG